MVTIRPPTHLSLVITILLLTFFYLLLLCKTTNKTNLLTPFVCLSPDLIKLGQIKLAVPHLPGTPHIFKSSFYLLCELIVIKLLYRRERRNFQRHKCYVMGVGQGDGLFFRGLCLFSDETLIITLLRRCQKRLFSTDF